MATEKTYTWTPTTETGFLNDELDAIWVAINANTASLGDYLPLAGGTLTGKLVISAAGAPYDLISGGSYTYAVRMQDGEGRYSSYWNTVGGASPTFIVATEKAGGQIFSPNANDYYQFLHSGPGTAHVADDPITWERAFSLFLPGGFQSGLDLGPTAGANIFESTVAGNKRGGFNPWLELMDSDGFASSYRLMADFKAPGTAAATMILGDSHQHKYFEGERITTNVSTGASPVSMAWNSEVNKDGIYTHDNSTNPERILVTKAGLYDLNVNLGLVWVSTTGTLRWTGSLTILKNGTTTLSPRAMNNYIRTAEGNNYSSMNLNVMLDLAADDYIELVITELSTAGIVIDAVAGECNVQLIYRGNSSA